MDVLALAREIINGRRLGRQDDLSFFLTCDLDQLCRGADEIRAACVGDKVDLCSIINGRSGRCPEDCKYCAQSAHNHTDCEVYDFLPQEEILRVCKLNEQEGVDRFSIVTAGGPSPGRSLTRPSRPMRPCTGRARSTCAPPWAFSARSSSTGCTRRG